MNIRDMMNKELSFKDLVKLVKELKKGNNRIRVSGTRIVSSNTFVVDRIHTDFEPRYLGNLYNQPFEIELG